MQRAATASSSRPICSTDACSPPIDVLAESRIVGDVLMSLMTFGETVLVWSAVKAWSAMAASNGSTVSGGPSGKNSVTGRVPMSFTLRRRGCCHRVEEVAAGLEPEDHCDWCCVDHEPFWHPLKCCARPVGSEHFEYLSIGDICARPSSRFLPMFRDL